MTDLHDWEREEFEADAQRIEQAGPRQYVYRSKHRGGRKIVGGDEIGECIDEMMPLRIEFERAQLAYCPPYRKGAGSAAHEAGVGHGEPA